MRVGAFSDTHGMLPHVDECEVLFICGDIMPLDIQSNMERSLEWLDRFFIPWAINRPVDYIFLVAGNHDMVFERSEHSVLNVLNECDKLLYLNCDEFTYISRDGKVYRIYGSPYCHVYGNWSFMIDDDNIKDRMSNMPEDVDFLLTHDAPYGVSDVCYDRYTGKKRHEGNKAIRDIILEKRPKYNIHGHIHPSNHEFETLGDTKVINVSILNENYQERYPILYFDV